MKTRIIGYAEIEERFSEIMMALERNPLDAEFVLEQGILLALALDLCVSQMSAPDSGSYLEKNVHLDKLRTAQAALTFKVNACTVEEVSNQVTAAYRAFAVQ